MSARGNPLGGSLDPTSDYTAGRRYIDVRRAIWPPPRRLAARARADRAMDTYYRPYPDQIARGRAYADKMDAVHAAYPGRSRCRALDGLAIIEGVDLNDKTFMPAETRRRASCRPSWRRTPTIPARRIT